MAAAIGLMDNRVDTSSENLAEAGKVVLKQAVDFAQMIFQKGDNATQKEKKFFQDLEKAIAGQEHVSAVAVLTSLGYDENYIFQKAGEIQKMSEAMESQSAKTIEVISSAVKSGVEVTRNTWDKMSGVAKGGAIAGVSLATMLALAAIFDFPPSANAAVSLAEAEARGLTQVEFTRLIAAEKYGVTADELEAFVLKGELPTKLVVGGNEYLTPAHLIGGVSGLMVSMIDGAIGMGTNNQANKYTAERTGDKSVWSQFMQEAKVQ